CLNEGTTSTPAELLEHMRTSLPLYLVPRYLEIRTSFPRTDTQKIRKAALRAEGNRGLTQTTWDAKTGALCHFPILPED
ncbi:MAG: hypothetical protein WCG92_26335, partial [Hyphomicrobiales bacterium]